MDPERAQARRELVIDVARAGDFSRFHRRDAARIAFAIPALAAEVDGDPYPELLGRHWDPYEEPSR